jgi:hypothetical protein
MNDSFAVGCVQGVGNLDADIEQRLQLESPAKDHFPQSLAFQIFHHQEEAPLVLANFVNGADVGVIQSRGGAGLTPEALERLGIVRQAVWQKLESDKTTELDVLSLIDDAHPAAADFFQDAVMRDRFPKDGLIVEHCGTS